MVLRPLEIHIKLELETDEELPNDLRDHILEAVADLDLMGSLVIIGTPILIALSGILDIIKDELRVLIVCLDVFKDGVDRADL